VRRNRNHGNAEAGATASVIAVKRDLVPAESAAIFYIALTQRLSRTSGFADSRRAVVASARSLFRRLPDDEQVAKIAAVERGFTAVGIPST